MKKYLYETHLHTYPVSKCGRAGVRESIECYKALGACSHKAKPSIFAERRIPLFRNWQMTSYERHLSRVSSFFTGDRGVERQRTLVRGVRIKAKAAAKACFRKAQPSIFAERRYPILLK